MNKAIIASATYFFMACAPELGAGEGERCDGRHVCSRGLECYRGFCIPIATEDSGFEQEDAGGEDGADPSDAAANGTDDGAPDASTHVATSSPDPSPVEAQPAPGTGRPSSPVTATSSPAEQEPPPSSPPESTPTRLTPAPASHTGDAGTPIDAGPPADAGARASADAATLSEPAPDRKCRIAECCDEAARHHLGEAEQDDKPGKGARGKSCGCTDPELLNTLACALLAPLGVLP